MAAAQSRVADGLRHSSRGESLMPLPLERFTVIDLTRARSGPTAVRQLADMGANVIKIEERGEIEGDSTALGFDFLNLHRNKRSMTLDLKHPRGVEIIKKLAARADVVVENFRPDVKKRLGIDYEALSRVNPRIVYGSISGFGQTGPYAERPGYDQIAQGMGTMLDFQAARWLVDGEIAPQAGNDHPTGIPTGVFTTSDGHINIAASGQTMYRRLCTAIGAPELIDDPRFKTLADRSKNRKAMNVELDKVLVKKPSAEWIEALNRAGVPSGPILNVREVFENEQIQHLKMAQPVRHPERGEMLVQGLPATLSRTPGAIRRAAPTHGEHTDEILRELGYTTEEIATLRKDAVV